MRNKEIRTMLLICTVGVSISLVGCNKNAEVIKPAVEVATISENIISENVVEDITVTTSSNDVVTEVVEDIETEGVSDVLVEDFIANESVKYILTDANIRDSADGVKVATLPKNSEIKVLGTTADGSWSKFILDGDSVWVASSLLSNEKVVVTQATEDIKVDMPAETVDLGESTGGTFGDLPVDYTVPDWGNIDGGGYIIE